MAVAAQPATFKTPSGKTYTAPAPGETLREGHFGEAVKNLQRQLNAAGAQPPLEVDGLYGAKTTAAIAKLDAAGKGIATDAYKAPKPKLQSTGVSQVQQAHVPDANQIVTGSLADKTLAIAESEVGSVDPLKRGSDGNYAGWDHLQDIFTKTTGWTPTDAEMKKSSQPQGKAWCGIFATHVLQEAGANVRWDLNKGQMVGDVSHVLAPKWNGTTYKAERAAFEKSIRPGDVITLDGKLNHHAIVSKVNDDGTVETLDGNKPGIGRGHAKLANVTSYYRPTGGDGASATVPMPKAAPAAAVASGPDTATAKQYQRELNAALGTKLAVDGKIGPKTTAAVKLFQSMSGLPQTGELDEKTAAALKAGTKPSGPLPAGAKVSGAVHRASANPLEESSAAEAAMAKNDARWQGVSVADIAKNPDAFIASCAQVDGMSSTTDQTSCGPTSVMLGVLAGRPQAVVELANKLVDANGNPTAECKKLFPKIAGADGLEYREVLKNMRGGTIRPIDITVLSRGLYEDMLASRPGGKPLGTGASDLIALRSKLSSLGVSIPRMELLFFGPEMQTNGMGHWQVGVNGKQYNPWPDANGKVGIVNDTEHNGIGLMKGRFGDDWACLQKIYIDDKTADLKVYDHSTEYTEPGKPPLEIIPEAAHRDPPLIDVHYTRQSDGSFAVGSYDDSVVLQQIYNYDDKTADQLYNHSIPMR